LLYLKKKKRQEQQSRRKTFGGATRLSSKKGGIPKIWGFFSNKKEEKKLGTHLSWERGLIMESVVGVSSSSRREGGERKSHYSPR